VLDEHFKSYSPGVFALCQSIAEESEHLSMAMRLLDPKAYPEALITQVIRMKGVVDQIVHITVRESVRHFVTKGSE